jgi:hypothetical protein
MIKNFFATMWERYSYLIVLIIISELGLWLVLKTL